MVVSWDSFVLGFCLGFSSNAASFGDLHATFEGMRQSNIVDKIGKLVSWQTQVYHCCCQWLLLWCIITPDSKFMNHVKLNKLASFRSNTYQCTNLQQFSIVKTTKDKVLGCLKFFPKESSSLTLKRKKTWLESCMGLDSAPPLLLMFVHVLLLLCRLTSPILHLLHR